MSWGLERPKAQSLHLPRPISSNLKWSGSFFKTNIFIVDYTLESPKKYFAENLEFCVPRNLLFSTARRQVQPNFFQIRQTADADGGNWQITSKLCEAWNPPY